MEWSVLESNGGNVITETPELQNSQHRTPAWEHYGKSCYIAEPMGMGLSDAFWLTPTSVCLQTAHGVRGSLKALELVWCGVVRFGFRGVAQGGFKLSV